MASRAAKRFKIHQSSTTSSSFVSDFKRGEDDYLPGNIIEIEIHNFMTYDHLTCRPASRLNLVIGPNGSGKSSLVCAIALGLAGEPQILGRAASIGAFVKRGEEKGYVKISLRGFTADEKITIQRKIDVHNKSDWTLNGATATKREVIEIIQKFNIQVNNLTQFLPQDRVCEFAKLTPIQLLEETEKAVGDPQLPVQHRALVDKSYELKKLEVTVKQNRETFNQLKALNAEQEKDVERVRQRNQLLAKADLMKKKLPWLRYDKKKAEYKGFQKRETEAKKKFDTCAKFLSELKVPIEEKKKIKAMHEASTKKINHQISENAKKRSELLEMEAKMGVQIRAKYKEMDEFKKQEETRQKRIIKAKEDLVIAERELEELPIYELPREKLESLRVEILELENSASQITMQATEKEHLLKQKKITLRQNIERLKEMENNNNKLLQALKHSGAEKIFEVYNWLQEHRSELRKEVYGPVLLEVTVNNRSHATYLENHVPNYIWKSIITQDPADRDFLVRNLKGYDVPILNYLEDRGDNLSPFRMTREMHDLGIQSRLDQVFDAPHAVKNVLVSQAMLDKSYIGSNETDRRADEVTKLGIMDLWTPESHYRWTKSRYGGHVSASVNPVQQSRLFMCSIDVSNLENLKLKKTDLESTIVELEESLKLLGEERRQLENDTAPLHKERENIHQQNNEAKKKRRDMENRVDQRRRMLQSLLGEEDLNSLSQKLIELVAQLNDKRFQLATKVKTLLIEAVALKWELAEKHLMSIEFDASIREMEADLKQQEKEALNASTQYENCKKEAEHCRRQLASAKQHAESIAPLTNELKHEFGEMPATIEELEAAILDNISEANSILLLNQNILQEYESRQRKIETMATKLETDELELNRCLSDIDTLKGSWLPTLRNLVAKINETFSRNFQEMAVAGEVTLDEHETDFDKYGIHIKVKFRESGQLQVLSAHHQSGGERSVSTILYLVSLQDLTNCPFRVVDEINQGMDPINERKMFQQLVRAASQQNTPQCFLLTPKLLPDLEYSPACSILNIMNGPYIKKPSQVWSCGGSWGMIMSSIQGSL